MGIRPPAFPVGQELDYVERTSNDTTTNTSGTDGNLAANKISGLTCEVVGAGRLVEVEFQCAGVYHSVANSPVMAYLLVNDSAAGGTLALTTSPSTTSGELLSLKRRMLLTDGTTYVFSIGKKLSAAGTGTYQAGTTFPMFLSVVSR